MARRDVQSGQFGPEIARETPAGAPTVEHLDLSNRAVAEFSQPAPGLDPTRQGSPVTVTPPVVGVAPGESVRQGGVGQVLDGVSGQGGSDDVASAFRRPILTNGREADAPGNR
jgi:hypothetical protein